MNVQDFDADIKIAVTLELNVLVLVVLPSVSDVISKCYCVKNYLSVTNCSYF